MFSSTLISMKDTWTMSERRASLAAFERDLRGAGLSENTVHTYADRSERFRGNGSASADQAVNAPAFSGQLTVNTDLRQHKNPSHTARQTSDSALENALGLV